MCVPRVPPITLVRSDTLHSLNQLITMLIHLMPVCDYAFSLLRSSIHNAWMKRREEKKKKKKPVKLANSHLLFVHSYRKQFVY